MAKPKLSHLAAPASARNRFVLAKSLENTSLIWTLQDALGQTRTSFAVLESEARSLPHLLVALEPTGMTFRSIRWLGCLLFTAALSAFSQDIIINEIMYHPLAEGAGTVEEWIELYNHGPTNVNLNGWAFTAGVNFRFGNNVTIPAGGYYVIAANLQSFRALYPGVNNVAGE